MYPLAGPRCRRIASSCRSFFSKGQARRRQHPRSCLHSSASASFLQLGLLLAEASDSSLLSSVVVRHNDSHIHIPWSRIAHTETFSECRSSRNQDSLSHSLKYADISPSLLDKHHKQCSASSRRWRRLLSLEVECLALPASGQA